MLKLLPKLLLALFLWGVFTYVIFYMDYPKSLTSATLLQLLFFFIPLSLALITTTNLFINFLLSSASISLGIILLLILKGLDSLNFVTTALTIISVYLLFSYFQKVKSKLKDGPKTGKVIKMTVEKKKLKLTKPL